MLIPQSPTGFGCLFPTGLIERGVALTLEPSLFVGIRLTTAQMQGYGELDKMIQILLGNDQVITYWRTMVNSNSSFGPTVMLLGDAPMPLFGCKVFSVLRLRFQLDSTRGSEPANFLS